MDALGRLALRLLPVKVICSLFDTSQGASGESRCIKPALRCISHRHFKLATSYEASAGEQTRDWNQLNMMSIRSQESVVGLSRCGVVQFFFHSVFPGCLNSEVPHRRNGTIRGIQSVLLLETDRHAAT